MVSTNGNINIDVVYTSKGFKTKDEYNNYQGIRNTRTRNVSISDLFSLIKSGHDFRSITGIGGNSKRCFLYTQIIPIDVDKSTISLKKCLSIIETNKPYLIPSIAYETMSCTENNFKYRLLYIFNEHLGIRKYKRLYKEITKELYSILNNIVIDDSFCNPEHYFLGTNENKYAVNFNKSFIDNNLYTINNDELNVSDTPVDNIENDIFSVSIEGIQDARDRAEAYVFNSDLYILNHYLNNATKHLMDELNGKNNLSPVEFLNKYKDTFTIYQKSNIKIGDNDCIETPDNYVNLNWFRLFKKGKIAKRKDGQRRHSTLNLVAQALKLINPNISPEEMLYNLIRERTLFIDNSDRMITNNDLRTIIIDTFKKENEQIIEIIKTNKNRPKYLLGKNRKSIGSTKGRKYKKGIYIDFIDWNKSIKENYSIIKELIPNFNVNYESFKKSYQRNNPNKMNKFNQ